MIKLGLIGVGFMGSTHSACYEILSNSADVKITAVADINAEKAQKHARKFGAKVYASAQELIDNADVDTVDLCIPTYLHAEYAIKAMEKGYNVFIEKPVCFNDEQAQKLLDTQIKTGKEVMIGQCIRLWDEYVYLKELVDSKKYGKIEYAVFKRISPRPGWSWENWYLDPLKSGSAVLDLHIHDVDYVRYIMGEPDTIDAKVCVIDGSNEHIFSTYTYGDVIVSIEGGWDYPSAFPFEMEYRVKFEKATVVFNSGKSVSLIVYLDNGEKIIPELNVKVNASKDDLGGNISSLGGYFNELEYFIECLNKGKKITIAPLSEGVKSFRLVLRELAIAKKM